MSKIIKRNCHPKDNSTETQRIRCHLCTGITYLPYTCSTCEKEYCFDCFYGHKKTCEKTNSNNERKHHQTDSISAYQFVCSFCGKRELQKIVCPDCHLQFCINHRKQFSHQCKLNKQVTKPKQSNHINQTIQSEDNNNIDNDNIERNKNESIIENETEKETNDENNMINKFETIETIESNEINEMNDLINLKDMKDYKEEEYKKEEEKEIIIQPIQQQFSCIQFCLNCLSYLPFGTSIIQFIKRHFLSIQAKGNTSISQSERMYFEFILPSGQSQWIFLDKNETIGNVFKSICLLCNLNSEYELYDLDTDLKNNINDNQTKRYIVMDEEKYIITPSKQIGLLSNYSTFFIMEID